jgi:CheY-like chemotaxis protein
VPAKFRPLLPPGAVKGDDVVVLDNLLDAHLRDVPGWFRPLLDARGQQLQVRLPPEPAWLEGDPVRLGQVLGNLLTNAAKYTPEGGHVWLTAGREDGQAVVRVRDDGTGIPADLLPRVFDLFTQGDRSPARSEGGLGVGLTVAKTLVELHGGSITAHSDGPGRGSEFVVHLPALAEKQEGAGGSAPAEDLPSADGVAASRVLVVEDNADAAESLALLVRLWGHEVRVARDGPSALELARSFRPEVVLCDLGLPGMDGYEVRRRLRQEAGPGGLTLVAVTGYGHDEDRRRSKEAGFGLHLVKPVDSTALKELLARIAGLSAAS